MVHFQKARADNRDEIKRIVRCCLYHISKAKFQISKKQLIYDYLLGSYTKKYNLHFSWHLKYKLLTFRGIFQPFHKFLHLLQEDTLSFGRVCIFVPFQDYFFSYYFSYGQIKSYSHKVLNTSGTIQNNPLAVQNETIRGDVEDNEIAYSYTT